VAAFQILRSARHFGIGPVVVFVAGSEDFWKCFHIFVVSADDAVR
jgi:hypothetical protein